MTNYDEQFENSLRQFRERRRLLGASQIHMKAAPAEVKSSCRNKLRRPGSVTFFWSPRAPEPWNKNIVWVMLGFDVRADLHLAEREVDQFEFRGRVIPIKVANRVAYRPQSLPASDVQQTAATTSAAAVITVPTTVDDEDDGDDCPVLIKRIITACTWWLTLTTSSQQCCSSPSDSIFKTFVIRIARHRPQSHHDPWRRKPTIHF
ncbi:hypothetical protein S40285_09979 [Stachybotrys chlorohalonatus IBT 40285]|uniref:Uncharacterized protein n=1 Tax=Stachybotrys chlorohalonatus (strain IBT 40285) TaxID=1283841 RepID=A0A084QPR7_STAC4|nr:hypothetical protein S40285_09979 [Stachybotrys chlorohalonata IBT 40285]